MTMIKVIYTDGSETNFHGSDFTHNSEHKMFFIETPGKKRIMIPDHCVACVGVWDKEKNEFA